MESGEEVRLCVQIHARLRWLNDASCELAECFFFFFKVLRSEWQSGKEDLSSCPRALYSLGLFLGFFCSSVHDYYCSVKSCSPSFTLLDLPRCQAPPYESIVMLNVSCWIAHSGNNKTISRLGAKSVRRMLPFVAFCWRIIDSFIGPLYWLKFNFGTEEKTAEKPGVGLCAGSNR